MSHGNGKLTAGSVPRLLGLLTLPVALGMGAAVTFNLADTWFVAQLGVDELAAMSYTFPLAFLLHAFSVGLGIGVTAVLSKTIGSGESGATITQTNHAIFLAAAIGLLFAGAGFVFFEPLFWLLGAEEKLLPLIRQYVYIWLAGTVFQLVVHIGEGILRASGDMVTPSLVLFGATALNIILDPLLIFGIGPFPRLEIMGAAVTTLFSSAVACGVVLFVLARGKGMFAITDNPFAKFTASCRSFFHIGGPAMVVQLILPLSIGILTGLASVHNEEAVAAVGAALRLETLAIIFFIAHSAVLMPFLGQNLGAKMKGRIFAGLTFSTSFIAIWGTGSGIALWLLAPWLAESFTANETAATYITEYLQIVPLSLPFYGFFILGSTALNGLQKPIDSAGVNALRLFLFFLPFTLLGNSFFGFTGLLWGIFLTNAASGAAGLYWLWRTARRETQRFQTAPSQQISETGE